MSAIRSYLQDPAWWFTAVIVAVIASVIAGFAKDYLERRLGIFFRWSGSRREQAKRLREEVIAAWSSSEALLTIALLHTLYWTVVTMGTLGLSAFAIMRPGMEGALRVTPRSLDLGDIILFGFLMTISVYNAVHTMTMIGRAREAMRAFRVARDLPKFARDLR